MLASEIASRLVLLHFVFEIIVIALLHRFLV